MRIFIIEHQLDDESDTWAPAFDELFWCPEDARDFLDAECESEQQDIYRVVPYDRLSE